MSRPSVAQSFFVGINALIGLGVGAATALYPQFAAMQIPTFAWLVLAMLLVELITGAAFRAHPSSLVSMPMRFAALSTSFVVCYVTLGLLKTG
jgi:ABC-type Fe3+-siderophore transport system permease subunit